MTDWDAFRGAYATMTYQEHRDFYDATAPLYPDQHHYGLSLAQEFFDTYQPATVIELGGWDGALANDILNTNHNISSWRNYEIADVPQACDHPAYHRVLPPTWAWEQPLQAEAFVASHSLEHLSADHLRALIAALDCQYAYVDVPIAGETSWGGFTGTHVLQHSLDQFDAEWEQAGWEIARTAVSCASVESQVRFMTHE